MNENFELIKSLEVKLTRADIRKNPSRLDALLCDDFQVFGQSGKVYSKPEIISALVNEQPIAIEFTDFKFMPLSDDTILVRYQSYCNRAKANRSSI